MSVIRRTKSGGALQVVLCEELPAGTVLQVPWSLVSSLNGTDTSKFLVCAILPIPANPNQFPKSVVFGGDQRLVKAHKDGLVKDVMSSRGQDKGKVGTVKSFKDSVVSF
jgi:hypothetical protein